MTRIRIDGLGIEYELLGDAGAPTAVITPGGRFSMDSLGVRELGQCLVAGGLRVLLWDRPNCGASDIRFSAEGESRLQARILMELVRTLELGPVVLAGGSAGARVSLLAALLEPTLVSHLAPWWISGGVLGLMMIGSHYCCETAVAASTGGMAAVADLPAWQDQIQRNPNNREIILRHDPQEFIATMETWAKAFIPTPGSPVPGIAPEQYADLTMPVLLFRGWPSDIYHPRFVTDQVRDLIPHAEYVDLPWQRDIFAERMASGPGLFVDWPDLAPDILNFVRSR